MKNNNDNSKQSPGSSKQKTDTSKSKDEAVFDHTALGGRDRMDMDIDEKDRKHRSDFASENSEEKSGESKLKDTLSGSAKPALRKGKTDI